MQEEVTRLQSKVQELERGRKTEINSLRLKYDAKVTRLPDIIQFIYHRGIIRSRTCPRTWPPRRSSPAG